MKGLQLEIEVLPRPQVIDSLTTTGFTCDGLVSQCGVEKVRLQLCFY